MSHWSDPVERFSWNHEFPDDFDFAGAAIPIHEPSLERTACTRCKTHHVPLRRGQFWVGDELMNGVTRQLHCDPCKSELAERRRAKKRREFDERMARAAAYRRNRERFAKTNADLGQLVRYLQMYDGAIAP